MTLITVDQLRPDHLTRYADLWTGGLERLLEEGYFFTAASHAHAFTETAAGHATLATGMVPARHGIVANDWFTPDGAGGWEEIYAVEDPEAPILNGLERSFAGDDAPPGRSPRNQVQEGLGDWIRRTHPDAEIVAISRKDRAAITMAGRSRDAHVYWIHGPSGRFVTSEWYRDPHAEWVDRFNRTAMPEIFADTVWTSVVPERAAHRSRPDTAAGEGDGVHTYFPHRAWQEAIGEEERARLGERTASGEPDLPAEVTAELNEWVYETPAMDRAVIGLALEAVDALDLGRDDGPDFLALSPSQADAVGHDYGPLSREQLDNLIRLDQELGRLFDELDGRVGEGRWVLAFSSDHGVLDLPQPGDGEEASRSALRRLGSSEIRDIRRILEAHGAPSPPTRDDSEASTAAASPEGLARELETLSFIAAVYPHSALAEAGMQADMAADTFLPLYRNSWFEDRYASDFSRYGIEVRFEEDVLVGYPSRGTGHGTPYWHDRHVPVVFLGGPVIPGVSDQPVFTYDVAPTLAALAGLRIPDGLDGRALELPRTTSRE